MPNWCDNDLYITGPSKERNKFLAACMIDNQLDFNTAIPYLDKYKQMDIDYHRARKGKDPKYTIKQYEKQYHTDRDGYNKGGYDWCCKHWGTKWNVHDAQIDHSDRRIVMNFDTAWGPPAPAILLWSGQFPKLTFMLKFYEAGVGFKGVVKVHAGETIEDITSSYRGNRGG